MWAEEWEVAPLGSRLLRIETGRSPSLTDTPAAPGHWGVLKVSAINSAGYRPMENKAVDDPTLINERFEVRPGDLLFSRANTPELVGAACIATASQERLMLSDKTLRLVVDKNLAEPEFVRLSLSSPAVRKQIAISASGSSLSMQNISQAAVEALKIQWPSLEEQRRIVEVLEALGEQERAIEAAIAKLRTVRRSMLVESIGRQVKVDPRAGSSGSFAVRDAGEVRMGKQLSPGSRQFGKQSPYLRVANVLDGWIDYADVKTMGFSEIEREIYRLLPGDVLLNEGQSLDLVGRSAIFRGYSEDVYFQNTLVRFRPGEGLSSDYVQAVFSYWLTTGVFAGIAKQTTSIAHLGGERFASLPFPMATAEEQERIARMLNAWDERIAGEKSTLEKLRVLKAGLVDDLLSGRADRVGVTAEL
ncbi:restriction endonuclease subunit S [Streptomyces sp. NPDC001393]